MRMLFVESDRRPKAPHPSLVYAQAYQVGGRVHVCSIGTLRLQVFVDRQHTLH